jgi:hypothetical protein
VPRLARLPCAFADAVAGAEDYHRCLRNTGVGIGVVEMISFGHGFSDRLTGCPQPPIRVSPDPLNFGVRAWAPAREQRSRPGDPTSTLYQSDLVNYRWDDPKVIV